jgi:predicted PurR-regulated permease PerM
VSLSTAEFARRVVIVGAIAAVAVLLWRLIDVVLLIFAGVILAVALVSLARLLMRHLPLGRRAALAAVICLATIAILGLAALMGARLATQFGQLGQTLQAEWTRLQQTRWAAELFQGGSRSVPVTSVSHFVTAAATGFAGAVTAAILIVFVGVFVAADPEWYERGVLRLVPVAACERTKRVLHALGTALSRWLRGVVVAMLSVGAATTLALWLIGIPLALSLGVLAGVLEFVPYVGPIVSAVPAVLVAFTVGPWPALEVAGLFLAIHFFEGYVLVPSIQKWAVALPPALAIVAVVIFGLLFGPIGIILAHPLMVCAIVLVEELYVRPGHRAA